MRIVIGLTMLALVVVAAGCGRAQTPAGPGEAAEPVRVEPTCPRDASLPVVPGQAPSSRGGVPDGFATAWVLRCRSEVREIPGQGRWTVQITDRADTDAAELVDQLRRPSDPPGGSCTLELVVPPYFVLVDAAGTAILPAMPTDSCGKPHPQAMAAVEALPFRTLSQTPLSQVESQRSLDTDCPDSWKDMVAIGAGTARPAPARPLWASPPTTIRICVYDRVSTDQIPAGQLRAGRTVTAGEAGKLLTALDRAATANPTCTAAPTRFAVLHSAAQWAMAELDGCRRLLRPDNTLGQLDEPTTVLIHA